MLSKEENERLTRVGPGTPAGEMLRRYWWPVSLSTDVTNKPHKVRLLGEDFVVFRDGRGELGLLDLHCAHRGASLEFGRVEKHGIRCCYHGWVFDVSGRCVEQPCEPTDRSFKDKVHQKAYQVQDAGGLIFAYIGPSPAPSLPRYDVVFKEDCRRVVFGRDAPYNWLQQAENLSDPYHIAFTHAVVYPEIAFEPPKAEFEEKWFGIEVRSQYPGGQRERLFHMFPSNVRLNLCRAGQEPSDLMIFNTPVDDTHTQGWFVWVSQSKEPPFGTTPQPYQHVAWNTVRRVEDGFFDVHDKDQDDASIGSQGQIADRTREHLGVSDRGILLFRRMVKRAIDDVKDGRDPIGVLRGTSDAIIELPVIKEGFGAEAGKIRNAEHGKRMGIKAIYEV